MRRIGEHAVVLGAGMAGLLAARVLTEAYERVTIVERDEPSLTGPRRGVPQGRHAHLLLPRGQRILEDLFPGLAAELVKGGAVRADPGTDHRINLGGHTLLREPGGERALQATRPFLEAAVRERLEGLPGVALTHGCDAVGLVMPDRRRVTGVRVMRRAAGSTAEEISADLVVDATGRGGRTRRWLEALGHGPVPRREIKIHGRYVTRPVRLSPEVLGAKAVIVGPRPGRPCALALVAVEDGRCLLTAAGLGEHRPPADPEGFRRYVAELAPPDLLSAIRAAEPLGELASHGYNGDLRLRYERMRRFPGGLLVTGDALCSFNPIYAQGMTVACLEAEVLRRSLATGARGLTRRYFRAVAKALDDPWRMAVAADLAMAEVPGRRSLAVRLTNAYVGRMQATAARDSAVGEQFARVTGLLDPPTALLRPEMLNRVLRRPAPRLSPAELPR